MTLMPGSSLSSRLGEDAAVLAAAVARALDQHRSFPETLEIALDYLDGYDEQVLVEAVLAVSRSEEQSDREGSSPRRRSARRRVRRRFDLAAVQHLTDLLFRMVPTLPLAERPSRLRGNIQLLCESVALTHAEQEFLYLLSCCTFLSKLDSFADDLVDALCSLSGAVALLLGLSRDEAQQMMSEKGALVRAGFIRVEGDGHGLLGRVKPTRRVVQALLRRHDSVQALTAAVVGEVVEASLTRDDYRHVQADHDLMVRLLAAAMKQRTPGVNILIHGPPGTGKTELAKLVATSCAARLFAAGEKDAVGDEPVRGERLQELLLMDRLLSCQSASLLMFDEMEDLFSPYGMPFRHAMGSKVFINRVLETNAVPIIWIANDLDAVPRTVLRRMMLAVKVGVPPPAARERLWQRLAEAHGVDLEAQDIAALARTRFSPPAMVANAVKVAALTGAGQADLKRALDGVGQTLGPAWPSVATAGEDPTVELRFACADIDLTSLVERLKTTEERRFSLCLYGPPGTGKTAFVRHLAVQMGLEVVQKRASDLLGPYVGQTEAAIAAAFQDAEAQGAFLVFDEADSLLADRGGALRSFEVSQVNEMLSWMERHPLPFACTTNLMDRVDAAALRRFTFKISYGFLTAPAVAEAFRHFFALEPPPGLADLQTLAPGDFVVVRRKAAILGDLKNAGRLVAMLSAEVAAKGGPRRAVGFSLPGR